MEDLIKINKDQLEALMLKKKLGQHTCVFYNIQRHSWQHPDSYIITRHIDIAIELYRNRTCFGSNSRYCKK